MPSSGEIAELDANSVLGAERGEIEELWRLVFLAGLSIPTAVLSTERSNTGAIALYARRGWQVILDEISFGDEYPHYLVMGRDLT